MATELTVQSERAFQKQPHIFVNTKAKRAKSTRAGKGGRRWFKDVGLGFRTPKTAIEGTYIGTNIFHVPAAFEGEADLEMQTRSVPSPVRSPSVGVSSPEPLSLPKCTEPSSSAANTSTLFPSTVDMKSATRTSQRTSRRRSVSKKATRLPSGSVGH